MILGHRFSYKGKIHAVAPDRNKWSLRTGGLMSTQVLVYMNVDALLFITFMACCLA